MYEHAMWMYPMTISTTKVVYFFSASSAWGDMFGQTISQLVGFTMSLLIFFGMVRNLRSSFSSFSSSLKTSESFSSTA